MDEAGSERLHRWLRGFLVAVVGIDVSKADFHACLISGKTRSRKSFPNNPSGFRALSKWFKNRRCGDVHVCMEATGPYWQALANACFTAGQRVSVVNPSRTAFFARSQLRRTKTDAVDAEMIAQFCASQQLELWMPPAPETLELRGLLTYRVQLVAQRLALRQVISQVTVSAALKRLHAGQLDGLNDAIAELEAQIRRLTQRHGDLRKQTQLLESIPGVGLLSAAAIVAKLPVERLRNAKAAAAYVGVTPRERQSGSSVLAKPRICKTGNSELRRDLYMPALVATRINPVFKRFADILKAKGKAPKVIIVAVMRKLIVLAYTLLKSGRTFDRAIA
jgi:transposase